MWAPLHKPLLSKQRKESTHWQQNQIFRKELQLANGGMNKKKKHWNIGLQHNRYLAKIRKSITEAARILSNVSPLSLSASHSCILQSPYQHYPSGKRNCSYLNLARAANAPSAQCCRHQGNLCLIGCFHHQW